MKLKDWVDKVVSSYKRGAWADKAPEGHHVISTCSEGCKHLSESGKVCFKIMNEIEQPFGCIHFEANEI